MITKFKLYLEGADFADQGSLLLTDKDALPFSFLDDGRVKIGNFSKTHGDFMTIIDYDRAYDGRIWIESETMAFWKYPPQNMIVDYIWRLKKEIDNSPEHVKKNYKITWRL